MLSSSKQTISALLIAWSFLAMLTINNEAISADSDKKRSQERSKPLEFGVCFHHNEEFIPSAEKTLKDLRGAGQFWIRGDFQHPAKDAAFAKDMKSKGLKVLALIPWYTKGSTKGWKEFAEKEIKAAAADVPAWEITNEPEMTWWGGPIPPPDYMRMLKEAREMIKKANPSALIIGPAVGATAEGAKYLRTLVDAGLLDYVDGVSVHYYIYHKNTDLDSIKKIIDARKPLWITETGWTTADQAGGEAAQAKYVREYYDPKSGKLGSDPAIQVIFNYELNDDRYPVPKGKDDGWGLTCGPKGAYKPKAAYKDFKALLGK